jgi:hypothetical protein
MSRLKLLPLLLLAACVVPGYRGLWQPKPADLIVTGDAGAQVAHLSVAVLGKWRGGDEDGELHVRFRVENIGTAPLRLPLARCELFSGDLQAFGAPRLVAGSDAEVPPGGTGTLDAGFPPINEDADLRGLQVRWLLSVGGRELPGSLTFSWTPPAYAPYYGSVSVGYGYGYPYGYGWGSPWCWGGPVFIPVQPPQAMPPHATPGPIKH